MADPEPLIRDISDTARWVAVYRAQETERPDAVFRDPFAHALAGDRGREIAAAQTFGNENSWAFVARTYLFDAVLTDEVKAGVDLVVNLAAGLDARPYRMDLPKTLRWVEIDYPQMLEYKAQVLSSAAPACMLERIPLDLSNLAGRRDLFARLGQTSTRALVISEGLLIYLSDDEVGALARDLGAVPSFQRWVVDIAAPGLLKMLQQRGGAMVAAAGAPYKFGPPDGAAYFEPFGWQALKVSSLLKAGARINRVPFFMKLLAKLPDPKKPPASRPWSAVVLLGRKTD